MMTLNRKVMNMRWVMIMFSLCFSSCGQPRIFNMKNYTQAVKSGFKKIPEAMQVERLFGEADHFISYSGPHVPQNWYTEVFFYGRYVLTMQVEVKTNSAFSEVTEVVGEPKFYLVEVKEIEGVSPDGTGWPGASFNGSGQRTFGLTDWKKIYDAKGDLSVIGITIHKDQPVDNFDFYVRATKAPRIQVRPD